MQPLLTAVHEQKYGLIIMLNSPGSRDCEGYGIFKDDQIHEGRCLSPLDIALAQDNMHIMSLLLTSKWVIGPLLQRALKYQAHKCFQRLIEHHYSRDIFWQKSPFYEKHDALKIFEHLDYYICNLSGYASRLRKESAIHILASVLADNKVNGPVERVLPDDLLEKVNHLLSFDDIKNICKDQIGKPLPYILYPFEPVRRLHRQLTGRQFNTYKDVLWELRWKVFDRELTSEQHSCSILQTCRILLDTLAIAITSWVIPSKWLISLTTKVVHIARYNDLEDTRSVCLSLRLINNVALLYLKRGLWHDNDLKNFYSGSFSVRFLSIGYLNVYQSRRHGCKHELTMYNDVCEHLKLLVAYGILDPGDLGNKLFWLASYQSILKMSTEFKSLFQQAEYESYRQFQDKHITKLHQDNLSLEKSAVLHSVIKTNCVPACRSLQDLCRAKPYSIVPHRNMQKTVEHIPLAKHLKLYLTLGVDSCV